jgi:hypothetical protein
VCLPCFHFSCGLFWLRVAVTGQRPTANEPRPTIHGSTRPSVNCPWSMVSCLPPVNCHPVNCQPCPSVNDPRPRFSASCHPSSVNCQLSSVLRSSVNDPRPTIHGPRLAQPSRPQRRDNASCCPSCQPSHRQLSTLSTNDHRFPPKSLSFILHEMDCTIVAFCIIAGL